MYGNAIRNDNDVEGWHNRLNRQGRPNMGFYLLVQILSSEADFSANQLRLVSEGKIKQRRRQRDKQADARLYMLWDKFRRGKITAKALLKSVAGVSGPVNS